MLVPINAKHTVPVPPTGRLGLWADNGWVRFRADSLMDSSPDDDLDIEDPVIAACRIYACGGNDLAERSYIAHI